jgi:hypothetical protein
MGRGPVSAVRLSEEPIEVRGRGRHEARGLRRVIPWQLQWADGSPLGVGLFEDEEAALDYTRRPVSRRRNSS